MDTSELQQLLAERAGEHPIRVSVYGEPGNWDATLLVNQIGNADRKARFRLSSASFVGNSI